MFIIYAQNMDVLDVGEKFILVESFKISYIKSCYTYVRNLVIFPCLYLLYIEIFQTPQQ